MKKRYSQSYTQLINAMKEDSLIMFVGSGISYNSGLPSWKELVDAFANELDISENKNYSTDNLKIAQFYYDTFGQNQYMKKIEEIFSRKGSIVPNELHELIERISPKHIITTNYDTLLEQQFEKGLLKYNVVASDNDIPYVKSEKYLIKMHGDFTKKNIVLKEDDYLDYHLNFPMISTLIQSLIMNHTLLFVGYSLSDSTFNSIFRLIQNTFERDAKFAYFYTPEEPSQIVRDYYKKKGIIIISNENTENNTTDLFIKTKNFLEEITNSKNGEVRNSNDLWNQISFLDKLNFVESKDLSKYTGLTGEAYLNSGHYDWDRDKNGNEKARFLIDKHEKIKNLVENKSILKSFLDLDIAKDRNLTENQYLSEAFQLYQQKKFSLAKAKFRELANDSYRRKDYFTFLLCEFNFEHIHVFWSDEEEYQVPIFSEGLNYLTQQIVDSTSGDDRKIVEYFRDVILNMNFLDRKVEIINNLFDIIRDEHDLYERGGVSFNNNLWKAEFEIHNLYHYINLNCICVEQYRPYQSVIKRYIEILLLSYDNSKKQESKKSDLLNEVSSVVRELDLEDVKIIISNLNPKLLEMYLRNYSFSKIRLTDKAKEFIFDKIDEFQQIERSVNLDDYREYKQLLSILPFIEYNEVSKLIKILKKQVLYFDLSKELKGILGMVIANINLLNGVSEKKQLATIIERHINDIVNNTIDLHYFNFEVYAKLLKMCKSEETEVDFLVEKLETDILKFKYDNQDITKIFDYTDLFVHFFDFFSVKTQNSIIELFSEYEELDQRKISFHKIISIMRAGVFEFPNLQKEVYSYLIDRINTDPPFQTYPDPVKDSLADLFYLKNNGCFKETSISTIIQGTKKDIKGIFPEVDWKWFNVRSDDVIEKLLEYRTSGDIKKYFATTDEDKEYVDNFIIRMCDEGKLSFNKK